MSTAHSIRTESFDSDVLDASRQKFVLVDFWAPWCGPCRALAPILDRIAEEFSAGLSVVKVNTDEEPDLAARYQIRGIPAVKLFRDGTVVDEFTGAQPLQAVREFLTRHVSPPADPRIEAAITAARNGGFEECERVLSGLAPAMQSEPSVLKARAILHFARIASLPDESDAIQTARVRGARHALGGELERAREALFAPMARNRRHALAQGKEDALRLFDLFERSDPALAAARRQLAGLLN
jgi:putative thioredoxin